MGNLQRAPEGNFCSASFMNTLGQSKTAERKLIDGGRLPFWKKPLRRKNRRHWQSLERFRMNSKNTGRFSLPLWTILSMGPATRIFRNGQQKDISKSRKRLEPNI